MKDELRREFGGATPRALVLDDNPRSRTMTERRLRKSGFEVQTCASLPEFHRLWRPGTFDVIVADWDLAANAKGDEVLLHVRDRDWEVPFVLVSGKLPEDGRRSKVLERLLEQGGARFVERGADGIERACEEAERLQLRRDLALLKVILALRPAVLKSLVVGTSSGVITTESILADLLKTPASRALAEGPIADAISKRTIHLTKPDNQG